MQQLLRFQLVFLALLSLNHAEQETHPMPLRLVLRFTAQAYEFLTTTCISTAILLIPLNLILDLIFSGHMCIWCTSDLIKQQSFILLKIFQLYILTIFHFSPFHEFTIFHSFTHSLSIFPFQSYPLFPHVQMTKIKLSRSLKEAGT